MKTLIISDTWDATSDLVTERLKNNAFRLNTDIIRDYTIEWNAEGFRISNPIGHAIALREVSGIYWRKPFTSELYSDQSGEDYFFYSECRYIVREIYNIAKMSGAHSLIEEGAERRLGKITQLSIAKEFFHIPSWRVVSGVEFHAPAETVVKSLSGQALSTEEVLYTTEVSNKILDRSFLWFTQDLKKKISDVTVCYVLGRLFSFELPVSNADIDWRTTLNLPETQRWRPFNMDADCENCVRSFMERCDLKFGRLDFVFDGRILWFLEVNPNGQWAWLDLNDEHGLITTMVKAIEGTLSVE